MKRHVCFLVYACGNLTKPAAKVAISALPTFASLQSKLTTEDGRIPAVSGAINRQLILARKRTSFCKDGIFGVTQSATKVVEEAFMVKRDFMCF